MLQSSVKHYFNRKIVVPHELMLSSENQVAVEKLSVYFASNNLGFESVPGGIWIRGRDNVELALDIVSKSGFPDAFPRLLPILKAAGYERYGREEVGFSEVVLRDQ